MTVVDLQQWKDGADNDRVNALHDSIMALIHAKKHSAGISLLAAISVAGYIMASIDVTHGNETPPKFKNLEKLIRRDYATWLGIINLVQSYPVDGENAS